MSIRIARVGTGSVARSNYLPFLSRQPDMSLAYFSRTRSKAEECAASFGGRVASRLSPAVFAGPCEGEKGW